MTTDWVFQPVAVETLGGFGPSTLTFLRKLGSMLSEASGDAREKAASYIRLAIQIQIGNAACVRETHSTRRILMRCFLCFCIFILSTAVSLLL